MPANFKTYEAQSRLIASIIAAHPELKLNYKGMHQPFLTVNPGSSRYVAHGDRRIGSKWKAGLIKSLSAISKHYGSEWSESGIEHHFRPLKKGAQALRDLVGQGKDTKDHDIHSVS